jgi:hypothetical protein
MRIFQTQCMRAAGQDGKSSSYSLAQVTPRRGEVVCSNPALPISSVYDYRNRLVEVKDYTGTIASGTLKQDVRYEYDTFNRRVARWADTNGNGTSDREEFYIYDGDDVVMDFVDVNGATGGVNPVLTTRYLHGPAVDQILAQEDINTRRATRPTCCGCSRISRGACATLSIRTARR